MLGAKVVVPGVHAGLKERKLFTPRGLSFALSCRPVVLLFSSITFRTLATFVGVNLLAFLLPTFLLRRPSIGSFVQARCQPWIDFRCRPCCWRETHAEAAQAARTEARSAPKVDPEYVLGLGAQ